VTIVAPEVRCENEMHRAWGFVLAASAVARMMAAYLAAQFGRN
jgi:hypothetical protein